MKKRIIRIIRYSLLSTAILGFVISGYQVYGKEIKKNVEAKRVLQSMEELEDEDWILDDLDEDSEAEYETSAVEQEDTSSKEQVDTSLQEQTKKEVSASEEEEKPKKKEDKKKKENNKKKEKKKKKVPMKKEKGHLYVDDIKEKTPKNYFEDMLFIGDSRTYGFYEFGKIPEATFFSKDGLNIYQLEDIKLTCGDYGKVTLEQLLKKKQFKRIYFMIGINELGYNLDENVEAFEKWVDKIRELQPETQLVIQGNLHVTKEYAKANKYENNKNINYVNKKIKAIAKKNKLLFINPNDIFDDENHCMAEDYSNDGVHPKALLFRSWLSWLANYVDYE